MYQDTQQVESSTLSSGRQGILEGPSLPQPFRSVPPDGAGSTLLIVLPLESRYYWNKINSTHLGRLQARLFHAEPRSFCLRAPSIVAFVHIPRTRSDLPPSFAYL